MNNLENICGICEDICGICGDIINMETTNITLKNTELKCGHRFHYTCIYYSYKYSKNPMCPYCRQEGGKLKTPVILCNGILKTGKNKGQRCKCKIINGSIYCGRHIKTNINN